jgi:hypothetical protein
VGNQFGLVADDEGLINFDGVLKGGDLVSQGSGGSFTVGFFSFVLFQVSRGFGVDGFLQIFQ